MTKDVLLSISGLQMAPDHESDSLEVISPGEYYYRNEKHYLLYDEVTEGYDEVTKNIIKVKPGYMELTKKGVTNVHMVFEEGKKNVTYYYTPFGSLLIGIDARKVDVEEMESQTTIDVHYALDINYEHVAECHIHVEVKPKGQTDFRLLDEKINNAES